jgi:hypothetical protein
VYVVVQGKCQAVKGLRFGADGNTISPASLDGETEEILVLVTAKQIKHTIVNYLSRRAIQGLICSYAGKNLAM